MSRTSCHKQRDSLFQQKVDISNRKGNSFLAFESVLWLTYFFASAPLNWILPCFCSSTLLCLLWYWSAALRFVCDGNSFRFFKQKCSNIILPAPSERRKMPLIIPVFLCCLKSFQSVHDLVNREKSGTVCRVIANA